jgi:type 1 glutamine amidotransferase
MANDASAANDVGATDLPPSAARQGKALIYIFSNLYFRHPSMEPAAATVEAALIPLGYTVEISKDQAKFSTAGLAGFTLVIMIGSCGEPLGQPETASVAALDAWIKAGGALVGIHAASAVAYPPTSRFVAIMGGRFVNHPGNLRPAACLPQGAHPSVATLPVPFNVRDEIYVHDGFNPANQVDLTCAAVNGTQLPIAWHRTEGMGRVFYSSLGHEIEVWRADSPLVKNHVLPGILWAADR